MLSPSNLRRLNQGSHQEQLEVAFLLCQHLLPKASLHHLSSILTKPLHIPDAQTGVPAIVHAHYLQALTDWATSKLNVSTSGTAQPQQGQNKKRSKASVSSASLDEGENCKVQVLDERLWWLCVYLCTAGARRIPHTIITAATNAVTLLSNSKHLPNSQSASNLLAGILNLLQAATQGQRSASAASAGEWQPSLESLCTFMIALNTLHKAAQAKHEESHQQSVLGLLLWTLQQTSNIVSIATSQRKVLSTVGQPKPLHAMLDLGFPEAVETTALRNLFSKPTRHQASQDKSLKHQVITAARELLQSALLHESHIPGLVDSCSILYRRQMKTKGDKAQDAADDQDDGEPNSRDTKSPSMDLDGLAVKVQSLKQYNISIIQILLLACCSSDKRFSSSAFNGLCWFLDAACNAIGRLRRIAILEANTAMKAALQQKANRDATRHSRQFKHETPYQFAEYNIFTVICGMLLQLAAGHQPAPCAPGEAPGQIIQVKSAKADKKKGRDNKQDKKRKRDAFDDGPDETNVPIVVNDGVKVGAVHALSTLITSARGLSIYEPTQDRNLVRLTFLTRLTQQVMDIYFSAAAQPAASAAQHPANSASVATCGFMCAMLDLEYRAITCDIPLMCSLLINTAASQQQQAHKQQLDPAPDAASNAITQVAESALPVSGAGISTAVACAVQLVRAYTELRQLPILIESLLLTLGDSMAGTALPAATQAAGDGDGDGDAAGQQASTPHVATDAHAVYHWSKILSDASFLAALQECIRQLPSGQYAVLVSVLAGVITKLYKAGTAAQPQSKSDDTSAGGSRAVGLLAAADFMAACLCAVRLELPTTSSIANSCSLVINNLAMPLISKLVVTVEKRDNKDVVSIASSCSLCFLVRLYQEATRLHASCCALNPEIKALPGQSVTDMLTLPTVPKNADGDMDEDASDDSSDDDDDDDMELIKSLQQGTAPAAAAAPPPPGSAPVAPPVTEKQVVKAVFMAGTFFAAAVAASGSLGRMLLEEAIDERKSRRDSASQEAGMTADNDLLVLVASRAYKPVIHEAISAVNQHQDKQAPLVSVCSQALAATLQRCLLQYAHVMQDRVAYLECACMNMEQAPVRSTLRAEAAATLSRVVSFLLPNQLAAIGVDGNRNDDLVCNDVTSHHPYVPAWVSLTCPPRSSSFSHAASDVATGCAAQAHQEAADSSSAALGLSRALLTQSTWMAAVRALSCFGPHASQDSIVSMLSCMMSAAGSSRQGTAAHSQATLLQQVSHSSHVVLALPGFQSQPHIQAALPHAVLRVQHALLRGLRKDAGCVLHHHQQELQHLEHAEQASQCLLDGNSKAACKQLKKLLKSQSECWETSGQKQPSTHRAGKDKQHGHHQQDAGDDFGNLRASVIAVSDGLQYMQQQVYTHTLRESDVQVLLLQAWCLSTSVAPLLHVAAATHTVSPAHDTTTLSTSICLCLRHSMSYIQHLQQALITCKMNSTMSGSQNSKLGQKDGTGAVSSDSDSILQYKVVSAWLSAVIEVLPSRYSVQQVQNVQELITAIAAVMEGAAMLELQAQQSAPADTKSTDQDVVLTCAVDIARSMAKSARKHTQRLALHVADGQHSQEDSQVLAHAGSACALLCALSSHVEETAQGGLQQVYAVYAYGHSAGKSVRKRKRQGAKAAVACVDAIQDSLRDTLTSLQQALDQYAQAHTDAKTGNSHQLDTLLLMAAAAVCRTAVVGRKQATDAQSTDTEPLPGTLIVNASCAQQLLVTVQQHMRSCAGSATTVTGRTVHASQQYKQRYQAAILSLLNAVSMTAPLVISQQAAAAQDQGNDSDVMQQDSDEDHGLDHNSNETGLVTGLLETHLAALEAMCAPTPMSTDHDKHTHTWAALAKADTVESLKHMLKTVGATCIVSCSHHILASMSQLQQHLGTIEPSSTVRGNATHAPQHQALLSLYSRTECLLALLEADSDQHVMKLIAADSQRIVATLTSILTTLLGTPSVELSSHASKHNDQNGAGHAQDRQLAAAVVTASLRVFESMIGRPVTFNVSSTLISSIMAITTALFQVSHDTINNMQGVAGSPAAALRSKSTATLWLATPMVSAAGLLVSCLRHRFDAVKSCLPLLNDTLRNMMTCLMTWASDHVLHQVETKVQVARKSRGLVTVVSMPCRVASETLSQCAAAISRVMEAVSSNRDHVPVVRQYCLYLLGDYITHVAMAQLPPLQDEELSQALQESQRPGQNSLLPDKAAATLKMGALQLMGLMGLKELQVLHMSMGPGYAGARRGVLAALRKEWEKNVKYSGKV